MINGFDYNTVNYLVNFIYSFIICASNHLERLSSDDSMSADIIVYFLLVTYKPTNIKCYDHNLSS